MDYADLEYFLSVALLSTAMLGMGATLTVRDFLKVARVPQAMVLMYLVQVVLSPLVAIALARLLRLPPDITVGLLLIAALPGGLFSNIITYLGRGHVALSVTATAIASLTCLITTSLVLRFVGRTDLPADFEMPVRVILSEIGLCLILPLLVGMAVRRFSERHHAAFSKQVIRLSLIILAVFVIAAISAGHLRGSQFGWRPIVALFFFGAINLWLCYGLGGVIRLSVDDRFTIGMECVVRNVQLGVLLKAKLFPSGSSDEIGDGVLYALLMYGGLCMGIAGFEAVSKRQQFGMMYKVRKNKQPVDSESPTNND